MRGLHTATPARDRCCRQTENVDKKNSTTNQAVKARGKTVARVVMPVTVPSYKFIDDNKEQHNQNNWPVARPEHSDELPKSTSSRLTTV